MTPVTIKGFFSSIQTGNRDAVEQTLQADTNLCNAEDENGLIALGVAAHYGQIEIVRLLLNYGADINSVSNSKVSYIPSNSALHAAIAGKAPINLVEFLLTEGADIHCVDSAGYTPLHIAAFDGDEEVVTMLLQYRADPGHKNTADQMTPHDIAKDKGNTDFIKAYEQYSAK
ncbi:ankyrin repeat domain-containing protein [Bacillus haikouensis]|uniref:ankyrin repeat domain-containing protein n=1 Tax=Bacillus haikouensis TaxID=1510468 RepID=UPI001557311F|nr:ankyrin repeat domain-containing protein [Bacillus haikouensis]NQD65378.1 ankyrin repeat domain-containing protein [Bacillus haikouensis]